MLESFPTFVFFFNDTATTEIYTLSLHDALPIFSRYSVPCSRSRRSAPKPVPARRSEEHTSELQSPCNLVCRRLLEKKKQATGISIRERTIWCGTSSRTPTARR